MKLLEHFKAMQAMCATFVAPGEYTDRQGNVFSDEDAGSDKLRDQAFINDTIYMLDGPEQREAERAFGEFMDEHEELQRQVAELRDKLAVAHSDRGRATTALAEERQIQNDLRDRLFDSELAYAKLRGYVERIEDERPVEMVPAPRERFLAHSPDGSEGASYQAFDHYSGNRTSPVKRWYHRS